jgi:hypothetical protein
MALRTYIPTSSVTGIRAQLRGTLSQRGKDRFGFRRVGNQSSREQTDGEETADGMDPAWSTSSPADTNPGTRRRVGEHFSPLVSGFLPSRSSRESGVTPGNLPLSNIIDPTRKKCSGPQMDVLTQATHPRILLARSSSLNETVLAECGLFSQSACATIAVRHKSSAGRLLRDPHMPRCRQVGLSTVS